MTDKPITPRATLAVLATLILSLCLGACEIPPPQTTTGILDANPTGQADNSQEPSPDTDRPTADTPVGVLIHRVDLPLDVSLDAAWLIVDESTVSLRTHGMWQANGLRIGILNAEQAPTFADSLPTILGESRAKLIGSPHPTTVRSTPRLIQPVTIDLTDPPKSIKVLHPQGGRLQLLAKITRDQAGQAYLELTPHHYKPKPDLVPRSPLEKQLDGTVYTPLTARLPLTPNTAAIVGLYRPWPKPQNTTDTTPDNQNPPPDNVTENTEATPPVDDTQILQEETPPNDPPQPPTIPNHLGKALMAGKRAGHDTQVLLIISIIED